MLIPLVVYWYLTAQTAQQFFRAAAVLGVSGLTDLFDGRIARRFNQITELGILLDPVAVAGLIMLRRGKKLNGANGSVRYAPLYSML